ncbi:hypothetical protein GCM10010306_097590 [Streptomyces umbrinus]|nr:hypothetical protein GCM10010306_097590 [Streptomyces umbrinus]
MDQPAVGRRLPRGDVRNREFLHVLPPVRADLPVFRGSSVESFPKPHTKEAVACRKTPSHPYAAEFPSGGVKGCPDLRVPDVMYPLDFEDFAILRSHHVG